MIILNCSFFRGIGISSDCILGMQITQEIVDPLKANNESFKSSLANSRMLLATL
jgi:hypothetical protein